jgi:uncharacterized phage protein (TIGR02220 family)
MSKITRQKRKDNYTVVNNSILQNPTLSWAAKGMLVYLLHLPDNWQINVADLSNRSKNGRDGTATIIKELMDEGYLTRQKMLTDQKRFAGYDYTVNDESVYGNTVYGKADTSKYYQKKVLNKVNTNIEDNVENEFSTPFLSQDEIEDLECQIFVSKSIEEIKKKVAPKKKESSTDMQIVTDVVNYLNEKTKQAFKPTTKETVQFIRSRASLDKWGLEDFKLVIDFKASDWMNDERMRQYLTPSTLFRAANAEKYLLAAKDWKERPVKMKPLKLQSDRMNKWEQWGKANGIL